MESQNNKLVYLAGGLGLLLLFILFGWMVFGPKKAISPLPEEGIQVIFTTPEPTLTPSPTATATATPKTTTKPTPKATVKP